jgi:crossover junction endodeoxyribonuclease RuvC
MRIIGIDPGTICCGYGIVELRVRSQESGRNTKLCTGEVTSPLPNSKLVHVASGEIRMNQKDPLPERLKILHDSLRTVIDEYKPSGLCIEKIFYHKSIRSALALGSTRGVVLLLAAQNGIPVFEYNSTELKMALTGYGRAEKRQVQHMVKILLGLNSAKLSEDSTDALALCICHIHSSSKSI